jgi:hypothetical protein
MRDLLHGHGEGLITAAMGLAILASDFYDYFTRSLGLAALVTGLYISLVRFSWDRKDRTNRQLAEARRRAGLATDRRIDP